MNLAQTIVLWIGIAIVAGLLIYPPWAFDRVNFAIEAQQRFMGREPAGYHFVWDAPSPPNAAPSIIETYLAGTEAGMSSDDALKLANEAVMAPRPRSIHHLMSPHIDIIRLLPPCIAVMLVTAGAMITVRRIGRTSRPLSA